MISFFFVLTVGGPEFLSPLGSEADDHMKDNSSSWSRFLPFNIFFLQDSKKEAARGGGYFLNGSGRNVQSDDTETLVWLQMIPIFSLNLETNRESVFPVRSYLNGYYPTAQRCVNKRHTTTVEYVLNRLSGGVKR